jgi:hypothetical protein
MEVPFLVIGSFGGSRRSFQQGTADATLRGHLVHEGSAARASIGILFAHFGPPSRGSAPTSIAGGRMRGLVRWCRGRDLNSHGSCGPGFLKPQIIEGTLNV